MTVATVPLFHAMTLWSVALENHFGWKRGALSLALSLTRVEGGLMGPVEGFLTDKLGARKMVLSGFMILGLGFLVFWKIDAGFWPVGPLYMFYVAYMIMALGQGMGSWVPMMTTINNWFSRRMASAMGWANWISRGGALIIIPLMDFGIHSNIGWQGTALTLAIVVFGAAIPLSFVIRNRPEDMGLEPEDDARPSSRGTAGGQRTPASQGLTAQQAVRTPAFWLIAIGHGLTSMIILAIFTHLGLLLKDADFENQVGRVVTTYTFVAMWAQLIGGYVGDRYSKRLCLHSGGRSRAAHLQHPVMDVLCLCGSIRTRVRRSQSTYHLHTRRILWTRQLRQDSGYQHNPDEHLAARSRSVRRIYVRLAAILYRGIPGAGRL